MKAKDFIRTIRKWFSLKRYREAISVYSDRASLKQFVSSILSESISIQKLNAFYQPIFRTYWDQDKHLISLHDTKHWDHYEQHKWQIHILAWKDIGSTPEFNEYIATKLFYFKCNHLLIEDKYPALPEWSSTSNSICVAMYNIVSVTMGISQGRFKASTSVVEIIDFWFKEIKLTKAGDFIFHFLMLNILKNVKDKLTDPDVQIKIAALEFLNSCLEKWILISPLTALILKTEEKIGLNKIKIHALFENQCDELHPWLIRQFVNNFSVNTPPDTVNVFNQIDKDLRAKKHTLWETAQWNMAFFMIDLYHFFTLSLPTMENIQALTGSKHKEDKKLIGQYEAFFKPLKYIQGVEKSLRITPRGIANSPQRIFRKKYRKMGQEIPVAEDWKNQRIGKIDAKLRAFHNHILSITTMEYKK